LESAADLYRGFGDTCGPDKIVPKVGEPPMDDPREKNSLDGRERVLLIEDEALVGLLIADSLSALGYMVVGPVSTLSGACEHAQNAAIDAALVDLNLHGLAADPVAEILTRRNIPFMFVSGYDDPPPAPYRDVGILHKPFTTDDLLRAVTVLTFGSVAPVWNSADGNNRES
jgi:CheY-like chemotaxis protein